MRPVLSTWASAGLVLGKFQGIRLHEDQYGRRLFGLEGSGEDIVNAAIQRFPGVYRERWPIAARTLGTVSLQLIAVRYGEGIWIVLGRDTGVDRAILVAVRQCERMRGAIVSADICQPLPHVTESFGVAALAPDGNDDTLMEVADAAFTGRGNQAATAQHVISAGGGLL